MEHILTKQKVTASKRCILLFLSVCLVFSLFMNGCYMPKNPFQLHPDEVKNCFWKSMDGSISFTVGEEMLFYDAPERDKLTPDLYYVDVRSNMYGEIIINEDISYNFFILEDENAYLILNEIKNEYVRDDFRVDNSLAYLKTKYKSEEHFHAEVIDGTLFEKGTKFEFHRTIP